MKDMCETAKERYQKTLTIFEASLRRGRPTKLSEVCRDNKVYYRGMLKWLYQTGRTIADIRKGITAESKSAESSGSLPSFVEISEATGNMEEGHPSHLLSKVTLAIGKGVTLSIDTADAGSLAEFDLKLVKEGGICSD